MFRIRQNTGGSWNGCGWICISIMSRRHARGKRQVCGKHQVAYFVCFAPHTIIAFRNVTWTSSRLFKWQPKMLTCNVFFYLWQLTLVDTPVGTPSASVGVRLLVPPPGGVGGFVPLVADVSAESFGAAQDSSIEAKKGKKGKFGLKMPSTFKRGKFSEVSRRVVVDTESATRLGNSKPVQN